MKIINAIPLEWIENNMKKYDGTDMEYVDDCYYYYSIVIDMMLEDWKKETTDSIPIKWLKEWDRKHRDEWNIGYTIPYIIKDWENEQ